MTKKEEVKAKIQALVPEIIHIITLADVVLALIKGLKGEWHLSTRGLKWITLETGVNWDLTQDYDNQPEEVYEFLHNILI